MKSVGSGTDDFKRTFSPINAQGATALEFWYFVDDKSDFDSVDQVELGSGGKPDTNEYNWEISRAIITNGWNYISLKFSDARITGGTPDKSRLNWFRLYRKKTGTVVSRIDKIILVGSTSRTALTGQEDLNSDHKLFPNPSKSGETFLLLNLEEGQNNAIISIRNALGQDIYVKQINNLSAGKNQVSLDIPLSPAMYFVEINANNKRQVIKWLVSN